MSAFTTESETRSSLRRPKAIVAAAESHSQTGEKTFVISGPAIGLFSSFSRSLTANAVAVAASSASTTSREARRRTARQSRQTP